ncbi:MAG: DciA family protein [bacterium]|nr:DciA family protein [bacterium]MDE0288056.1 DciA family protein [bacterium]MDE0438503.1 DciA family protein [bacterium]
MTDQVSPEQLETMLAGLDDLSARVIRLIWEEGQETGDDEGGLVPVAEGVQRVAASLGLPPMALLEELIERWPELAGSRWGSRASPIVVRHGELLVEAADRRIVRWLQHDTDQLVERIAGYFGPAFVTRVRVVGPAGRKGW